MRLIIVIMHSYGDGDGDEDAVDSYTHCNGNVSLEDDRLTLKLTEE